MNSILLPKDEKIQKKKSKAFQRALRAVTTSANLNYITTKMKFIRKRIGNVLFVKWKIIMDTEDVLTIIDWYQKTEAIPIGGIFIALASKRRANTKAILRKISGTVTFRK